AADDSPNERRISVLSGPGEIYTFAGYTETVFVQFKDVLYVARTGPDDCQIVAYDLKARKELWACPLRGNPTGIHLWHCSRFGRHPMPVIRTNIEVDGDALLVFGKDWGGRFVEYVDLRSGKTIGYKKLPPE